MRAIFFRTNRNIQYTMSAAHKKVKSNSGRTPEVLIADDDPEAAQILQVALTYLGVNVTIAFNGKQAMEALSKRYYDIVFLDYYMPHLNGAELLEQVEHLRLRHISKNKNWKELPVIIYSSEDIEKMGIPQEEGFKLIDCWQKPLSLPSLTSLAAQTIKELGLTLTRKEGEIL